MCNFVHLCFYLGPSLPPPFTCPHFTIDFPVHQEFTASFNGFLFSFFLPFTLFSTHYLLHLSLNYHLLLFSYSFSSCSILLVLAFVLFVLVPFPLYFTFLLRPLLFFFFFSSSSPSSPPLPLLRLVRTRLSPEGKTIPFLSASFFFLRKTD